MQREAMEAATSVKSNLPTGRMKDQRNSPREKNGTKPSRRMLLVKRSEVDFAEELNNTSSDASSLEGAVRAGWRSCDRADGSKTATCDVRCRQGKVGMVE